MRFLIGFLNHREGGMVFYQIFLLSPLQCAVAECRNCKRLREFEEEISRRRRPQGARRNTNYMSKPSFEKILYIYYELRCALHRGDRDCKEVGTCGEPELE
jgi:hypothetical protein